MKTGRLLLFFLLSFCFTISMNAQLPDGTSAPDWTASDINGVQYDMSDILATGKHVVLEFSATWCGPCWNFHQTGTMETLHDTYGPDGTDQIRVFYIEADQSTNTACLYGPTGCNSSTQGDWVTGHDFPFIDVTSSNGGSMPSDYNIAAYPTIVAVSANGNNGQYNIGQETNISNWESWFFESFEMDLTSNVNDAFCPGDGSIQVTPINGAGSIAYQWSNGGGNTDYIGGLSAGSYTVTATDDNGYEIVQTIEVDGPTDGPLAVELLADSDVLCFGENSGALSVGGDGGNGGYSFAWSTGASGPYVDGLPMGSYSVVVTDSQGCTSEETYTIDQPDLLSLTSLPEDANCGAEDGGVVAFAIGGTGPWLYDFGDGPNYTGTFSDVSPGNYVMTVTDDNGCEDMSAFTISATEGPTADAQTDDTIDCSTVEVIVSGAGSSEGDDIAYEWTSSDGAIVSGSDAIDAVVSAAGTYTLAVTNTTTGCVTEVSVTVDANVDAPAAAIADPTELNCNISMTTLDGSESSEGDNITYAWSTDDGNIASGANTDSPEVDVAGTYTLLVTNSDNGCTSTESVTVVADEELPAVSVVDLELDCSTTEAEICADVDASTIVTWMTPEGEVEATCITVSMAGSYTALAKGTNGCEASATSEVTLSADLPQVSIGSPETITCTVTTVTVDAELEGDLADFNLEWKDEAGVVINSSDLSIEVEDAGTYTLEVTNIANGCTTVSSVSVDEVIVNPVSAFTSSLDDGTLVLESGASGDPSAYSWSFGSTDENTETTFDETGTYEVCLTVTNDCGDDTYCQDVYFVSQLLFESVKSDALCNDGNDGSITVTPSGGEPEYTVSWVGPNGFTSTDLALTGLAAGEYSMVLNDAYGYEKTESYVIDQPVAISQSSVEITDETNSDGNGSITLEVAGGTGELMYEWSNGATTASISDISAGEYSVIVTDENGCQQEFGPFDVVSSTVGVEELDFVASLSMYPIPANNYLNVNVTLQDAQTTQMRVLDAYGKVISTSTFTGKEISTRIDVTEMASGIYYVEFGNENGRSLEKFVVVR